MKYTIFVRTKPKKYQKFFLLSYSDWYLDVLRKHKTFYTKFDVCNKSHNNYSDTALFDNGHLEDTVYIHVTLINFRTHHYFFHLHTDTDHLLVLHCQTSLHNADPSPHTYTHTHTCTHKHVHLYTAG